jgi:4-hydroxy-3-methylbut-2-enyl diphosphate reductase
VLVESVADVEGLVIENPDRLACVTQTTLSVDDTREILDALRRRFPKIELPKRDDICYATQNRQDAVAKLAERAQLILVVGAPESSNSNRLVEVAQRRGVPSHLVQNAADVDPAWLEGVGCVGVTAGASTPEFLVQELIAHLGKLVGTAVTVNSLPEVDEGMTFKLPAELRG